MNFPQGHLIEPDELVQALQQQTELLIIDLCSDQQYLQGHIPGAIHVSPAELMDGRPPAPGKLPDKSRLDTLFSRIGLREAKTVIVYDDEGGGWAGRMAWTLDVIGHKQWMYLNGGLVSWLKEGLALETEIPAPRSSHCDITVSYKPIIEAEEIIFDLDKRTLTIWDARGKEEYDGTKVVAHRGGHIPGATHCEWTSLMDSNAGLRIRSDAQVYLNQMGLSANKAIVTHCQSHHRSGFTYMVARILGYPNIRAYPGSWSEWGNRMDTPIESKV